MTSEYFYLFIYLQHAPLHLVTLHASEYVGVLKVVFALTINTDIKISQYFGSRPNFNSVASFKPAAMDSD